MSSIKKTTVVSLCALAACGIAFARVPAQATPLSSSFTISVWVGTGSGSNTDSIEQALPTNTLASHFNPIATFTYTGAINFAEGAQGSNNILDFLKSANGTLSNFTVGQMSDLNTTMSSGNFKLTTLMKITGSSNHALAGTVSHDDGISIYQNEHSLVDASGPTSLASTSFSNLSGSFDLWYVEANGLPANLTMDVTSVPEPASMAVLGAGLVGLGVAGRRRQTTAAAC